jgi:MoaA/NifB/PqqE/SkfB family radical SAM enzyme
MVNTSCDVAMNCSAETGPFPKITKRVEPWGELYYNFDMDEFTARVKPGHNPIPQTPIGIGWLIVGSCNLKCIHCYGNAEQLPKIVLSTADCFHVVDRFIEADVMRVVVSGGEPMFRDDLFKLLDLLSSNQIGVVLGTNGSLIDSENVKALRSCVRVEISLDAATREINNTIRPSRIRGGDGWQDTIKAIKLCLDNEVKVRVLTAVNSFNQNHLYDMASILQDLNVSDWALSWVMPIGRAFPIFNALQPEENIVAQQMGSIRERYSNMKIRLTNRSSTYNRFYCLVFPDGQMGTEEITTGQKLYFGSLLQQPVSAMWNKVNYNLNQHFDKWVGDRFEFAEPNTTHISQSLS